MAETEIHIRPQTLIPGGVYLWRRARLEGLPPEITAVQFVAYDNCPAFAIIAPPGGRRQRCPRDELFALSRPEGFNPAAAVGKTLKGKQEDSLLLL